MKKSMGLTVLALAAVMAFLPAPINAGQTDPKDTVIESLNFEQADIRDAIKVLFDQVGVSYTIDSNVQGTVIANLKNVTFETALRNLLNQVNATWRVEGGIYNIILKPDPGSANPVTPGNQEVAERTNPVVRIPIRYADPQLIVLILSGQAAIDTQPEITALTLGALPQGGSGGGGGFSGGGGGGGFSGGGGGFSGGGGGGFSGGGGGGGFGGGGGLSGGGGFGGGGR